eukprot:11192565-Alexandrium_andersonii.AAC.1
MREEDEEAKQKELEGVMNPIKSELHEKDEYENKEKESEMAQSSCELHQWAADSFKPAGSEDKAE